MNRLCLYILAGLLWILGGYSYAVVKTRSMGQESVVHEYVQGSTRNKIGKTVTRLPVPSRRQLTAKDDVTDFFPAKERAFDSESVVVDVKSLMQFRHGWPCQGTNCFSRLWNYTFSHPVGQTQIVEPFRGRRIEQRLYFTPDNTGRAFTAPFEVVDHNNNRHNGFIEQRAVVEGELLKEMTFVLYMVPHSSNNDDNFIIRRKHGVLAFRFYMSRSQRVLRGVSQRLLQGVRTHRLYIPVDIEQMQEHGTVEIFSIPYSLANHALAQKLEENLQVAYGGDRNRLMPEKSQGVFGFRYNGARGKNLEYSGVYPLADMDAFKRILKDYARYSAHGKRGYIIDRLVDSKRNPSYIRVRTSSSKTVKETLFYWLVRTDDGAVSVPTSEGLVKLKPKVYKDSNAPGVIWSSE